MRLSSFAVLALVVGGALVWSPSARAAAPTIVQSCSNVLSGPQANVACTFGSPVTAGNQLWVCVATLNFLGPNSLSFSGDSAGFTADVTNFLWNGGNAQSSCAYINSAHGTETALTATSANMQNPQITAVEINGGVFDQADSGVDNASGKTPASNNITPANNSLLLGVVENNSPVTIQPGTNVAWAITTTTVGAGNSTAVENFTMATGTPVNAQFTFVTFPATAFAHIVSFRPATSALAITTTTLPNGVRNAAYSSTVVASGGTPPYTWSISAGSLPSALGLGSSTGTISGTLGASLGTTSFTVKVTDSVSAMATQPLSITVTVPTCTFALSADITLSATSGGWTGTGCPLIPGVGDTGDIVITTGAHNLTVDETLWSLGSFTFASSVEISSGHTMYFNQNSLWNAGTFQIDGGGTVQMDNSASPMGTSITLGTTGNGGTPNMHFACNGSSGSHGIFQGIANASGDQPAVVNPGQSIDFGSMSGSWCDFSNMGSATVPAWQWEDAITGSGGINISHLNCTHCGEFPALGATDEHSSNNNFEISYGSHDQTLGGNAFFATITNAPTGGAVYELHHNSFDAATGYPNSRINGANWHDNVWHGVTSVSQDLGFVYASNAGSFAATNNVIGFNLQSVLNGAPSTWDNNLMIQYSSSTSNTHTATYTSIVTTFTWGRTVVDETAIETPAAEPADGLGLEGIDSAAHSITMTGIISPPNPQGFVGDAWFVVAMPTWGAFANTIRVNHNTSFLGVGAGGTCAWPAHPTTANQLAIGTVQDNICESPVTGGLGYLALVGSANSPTDVSSTTLNFVDPAGANHNETAGLAVPGSTSCDGASCGNTVQGYLMNMTGTTPGTGDSTRSALMPDVYRTVMMFDCMYMNPASFCSYPAWSLGTAYSYGAIVNYSNPAYWQNHKGLKTVNFRCANLSGCPGGVADNEPITGANWGQFWEPAALYQLGVATARGDVYVDGAIGCTQASPCSPAQAANNWMRRAFAPQSRHVCGAAHDGSDMGAVPCDPPYAGVL